MKFTAFFKGYDHVLPELALCVAAMYLVAICLQGEFLSRTAQNHTAGGNTVSTAPTREHSERNTTPVASEPAAGPKADSPAGRGEGGGVSRNNASQMILAVTGPVGGGKAFGALDGNPVSDLNDLRSRIAQQQAAGKMQGVLVRYTLEDASIRTVQAIVEVIYEMKVPVQLEGAP